ncbi:hypothetical protein PG993_000805 [Apiospora rasikravindrae]|uniref:Uncharacterized protein n=1 Tax=Apiospora rasikravindrae TaxID=990691 RepID=A0ABR1UCB6_9PEZI
MVPQPGQRIFTGEAGNAGESQVTILVTRLQMPPLSFSPFPSVEEKVVGYGSHLGKKYIAHWKEKESEEESAVDRSAS